MNDRFTINLGEEKNDYDSIAELSFIALFILLVLLGEYISTFDIKDHIK